MRGEWLEPVGGEGGTGSGRGGRDRSQEEKRDRGGEGAFGFFLGEGLATCEVRLSTASDYQELDEEDDASSSEESREAPRELRAAARTEGFESCRATWERLRLMARETWTEGAWEANALIASTRVSGTRQDDAIRKRAARESAE